MSLPDLKEKINLPSYPNNYLEHSSILKHLGTLLKFSGDLKMILMAFVLEEGLKLFRKKGY